MSVPAGQEIRKLPLSQVLESLPEAHLEWFKKVKEEMGLPDTDVMLKLNTTTMRPKESIEVCIEEKVPLFCAGLGNPGFMVEEAHAQGMRVLGITGQGTIVGRHGGFADKVRCKAEWAILLPEGVDVKKAGPLFCGGITVFHPMIAFGVKPTDRVAVIGIGGLGHLALQFLAKWGCEVTAFTSSESKRQEALERANVDLDNLRATPEAKPAPA